MSPDPANRNPQSDELEAAIDALLAEIDTTCTRFEKPVTPTDEDEPDSTDADDTQPTSAEPAPAAPAKAATSSDAEEAVEQAATNVEGLLEQAADDLLDALESEVEQARPEAAQAPAPPTQKPAQPERSSNDDLLEGALDDLLTNPKPDAESDAGITEPAEPEPEAKADIPPSDPAEAATDAIASLDAAFDDLLDGTFESADGQAVDTEGLDTQPDPSLMLDTERAAPARDAEPATQPEAAPDPDSQTTPAPAAPAAKQAQRANTEPAQSAPVVPPATARRTGPQKTGDLLETIRVRVAPFARATGAAALDLARPVGARALVLLSKPLEGKSPRVRDSIGWVAIWTLFLAVCVWAYLMIRAPQPAVPDSDASRVVTAETTPAG